MNETSSKQFGLLVAYLLPGFIGLFGIAPFVPAVADWLRPVNQADLGIAPTAYAILAAIAMGMILSCFRWLIIDHVHRWTGVRRPAMDASHPETRLDAFDYVVEAHYRYYQFYSGTIIAIALAYGLNRFIKPSPFLGFGTDLGVAILCTVLFVGSRDALSNYYAGMSRLVGYVAEKDHTGTPMTNGCGHDSVGCAAAPRSTPPVKSYDKSQAPGAPQSSDADERVSNRVGEPQRNPSVADGEAQLRAADADSR